MHLSVHLSCLAALLGLTSSRCLSPAPVEPLGGCWFAVWGRQLALGRQHLGFINSDTGDALKQTTHAAGAPQGVLQGPIFFNFMWTEQSP